MVTWQENLHILLATESVFTHSSLPAPLSSLLLNILKPCHPLGPNTSALLSHTFHPLFLIDQAISLFHLMTSTTPHLFPSPLLAIPSHNPFHWHHRHFLDNSTHRVDSHTECSFMSMLSDCHYFAY